MNANIMQEEMMEALQVVNRTFDEADIQFAQIALGIADDASQGLFDGVSTSTMLRRPTTVTTTNLNCLIVEL